MIIIRTPVVRVGNKTNLLKIIFGKFPLIYKKFVDLFGGSGSVLLGQPKKVPFEVYNDWDRNLVNLFRCIRDRPMALIRELGFYKLNARDDFSVMVKFFKNEQFTDPYMEEELELTKLMLPEPSASEMVELRKRLIWDYDVRRAAMFFKLLRTSYASTGKSFAAQPFDIRKLFRLIQEASDRLADVVIENQDFEVCINHFDSPDTLFYADPPYRNSEDMYDADFNWSDHIRLRDCAKRIKGKIMISYNDCPEVRQLYKEFYIYSFKRVHSMVQHIHPGQEFKELIITNYDMFEREKAKPKQLTMFDMTGNLLEEYDTFDYERILQNCHVPVTVDPNVIEKGT